MKCPFVFADGRPCTDEEGHEEYALNCGHLPPPPVEEPSPHTLRKMQMSSTYGRRMPALAAVAMVAMMGAGDPMGRPSAPRLPPLPPPPDAPPPLPTTMKARGRFGRSGGTQPLPRAFYSGRLLPGEDPGEIQGLLDQAEKRASDERHLTAAEEKRARKARKRLGK